MCRYLHSPSTPCHANALVDSRLRRYALFEQEQGDVDAARELHERAIAIDSTSVTSLYNR